MDEQLLTQLEKADGLPCLPVVVAEVLGMVRDDTVSMESIAACLENDPALAAYLLKISNSAFYGKRYSVSTVRQALQLIGLNAAVPLLLSFSVKGLVKQENSTLDLDLFWRRSIITACVCAKLADLSPMVEKEEAMLVGLVQDIGMLAINNAFPAAYEGLPQSMWMGHDQLLEHETKTCGGDHVAIGSWLLSTWDFPTDIVSAVVHSHAVPERGRKDLTWCSGGAGLIADVIMRGLSGGDLWKELRAALHFYWLNIAERNIDALAMEIMELVVEAEEIFEVKVIPELVLQELKRWKHD